MKINVNGKPVEIDEELTVKDLLDRGYTEMQEYVTVQVNEDIIPKENYANVSIKDGDVIEFLYYMGGGRK
ncbi:MAG TPA: sulfur carrier protein ThiS [Desulfitobacteriaceae bacterium]|nr:sulfur carrier protein ThiS [Desulfitobacteriaceae bacterium]